MKGYCKNNSPISYGIWTRDQNATLSLFANRDIYVLKINPETGCYDHIKTISPEREVCLDPYQGFYFKSNTSHEELRKKVFGECDLKDCVLATDRIWQKEDYSFYYGFHKIFDGKWIKSESINFDVNKDLYLDYVYDKNKNDDILRKQKTDPIIAAILMSLFFVVVVLPVIGKILGVF